MGFVPLHCHSVFSFCAGVCTTGELVRQARASGMKAVALTDTDRMSGLIRFYLECRAEGIKPILGVELTEPNRPHEHIVLLARNAAGYADLCEIITRRHLDSKTFSFSRVFTRGWPNLIFLSAFPHLVEFLAQTPNRGHLYGELINHSPCTRQRSRQLEETAKALDVPLVVSNNSFFLHGDDWETHRILAAIRLTSTLSRLKPEETAPQGASFRSQGEMEHLFPNHREAIDNTEHIAAQCDAALELGKWILPEISVPEGYTPRTYLEKLAGEGLEVNYRGKAGAYKKAKRLQEMELDVISKLGYPSYFLFVKQIRDWANERFKTRYRRPKDATILRGSAANSITFYNIGASDLDPIEYNLYFQRFLNEDRASPPDADLDFGWDERDEVFDYIIEKWGQDRVAVTCTTNHFRRRAAFRETAKVFGYSEEQVSDILESHRTRTKKIEDEEICHILELAERIRGKPRFLGQHPGGLLITNDPIWRHVACESSGGEKNRVITQIDMYNGIDELGLIKFDVLGNGSLSVLRDTLQQLEDQSLPDPDVWDLEKCYNDPRVRDVIRKGRTKGIFYIESPAQTRLNKKAQAESFEEITITSSLVRPAGSAYTQLFIERHRKMKTGVRDWDFLHPSLEAILGETHDVCVFQEDVTKICHHIAGLSYKQADKIRKMMNSSHEGEVPFVGWKQTSREFVRGCIDHSGYAFEQAVELWERVSSFTGFSFCKSHSASYAQLSFRCTYLKAHYPAQFLASVISNNHGFYVKDAYLNEARRWGIRILPLHINESGIKYWGKHSWMRPGLMHIRNLSQRSQEALIFERERGGPFRNLLDFVDRVSIHKKEIEKLILVGAFDGFGLTQPESLYLLEGIYGKRRPEQPMLLSCDDRRQELHPGLSDYTLVERCLNELHLLGFMLSGDILDILDLHPASKDAVPANQVHHHVGKKIKVFGWPVTERVHPVAHSSEPMMFLTLEDKTETLDIIFWPRIYHRFSDLLVETGPFEIWGTVTEDWGAYSVEAESIRSVAWSPNLVDFDLASKRLETSFKVKYTYADIRPTIAA